MELLLFISTQYVFFRLFVLANNLFYLLLFFGGNLHEIIAMLKVIENVVINSKEWIVTQYPIRLLLVHSRCVPVPGAEPGAIFPTTADSIERKNVWIWVHQVLHPDGTYVPQFDYLCQVLSCFGGRGEGSWDLPVYIP